MNKELESKITKPTFAIIVLLILLIATCTGCYNENATNSSFQNDDTQIQDATDQYIEGIPDDFSLQINEIEMLLNQEIIGIVYFGRDSCPLCLTLNSILQNECSNNGELIIYKFDTDRWREDTQFQLVLDKYEIKKVPALIRIEEDGSFSSFTVSDELNDSEAVSSLQKFLNLNSDYTIGQ